MRPFRILIPPLVLATVTITLTRVELSAAEPTWQREGIREIQEMARAAVAQWRDQVEFSCHFVYRGVSVPDAQTAFSDNLDIARYPGTKITGIYVKDGDSVRLSWNRDRPPTIEAEGRGGAFVSGMSFDQASVGPLSLEWTKMLGSSDDLVRLQKRLDGDEWKWKAGPLDTAANLTPFVLHGGHDDFVFQGWDDEGKNPNCSYEWAFRYEGADYLAIKLVRTFPGQTVVTRQTKFWMQPAVPTVLQMEHTEQSPGRPDMRAVTRGFDLVECGGVMMARRVSSVSGPVVALGAAEPHYIVSEWASDDLGRTQPKDEDFVVTIPAGIRVRGLREPPPRVDDASVLDRTKITLDDRIDPWEVLDGTDGTERTSTFLRWALGLLTLGLIVVVALAYRRIARRRGRSVP